MTWQAVNFAIPGSVSEASDTPSLTALNGEVSVLVGHAFQEGVGMGRGTNQHCSFESLANIIAEKIEDQKDNKTPAGSFSIVGFSVSASSLQAFSDNLTAFLSSCYFSDFVAVQSRAEELAGLESTKMLLPLDPLYGSIKWRDNTPNLLPVIQSVSDARLREIAAEESKNLIPDHIAALANLKTAKINHDGIVANLVSNLSIDSAPGWAIYATGQRDSIAQAMKSGGPGHRDSLAAIAVFAGPDDLLLPLKELFGL